jgi:hydroxyacylglutathione hydrolase
LFQNIFYSRYICFYLIALFCSASAQAQTNLVDKVKSKRWIHGQQNCALNKQPAIDVLKLSESTYIFRQNKCTHYEAPFIYLLLGKQKALLFDTGATADTEHFPLSQLVIQTVKQFQAKFQLAPIELIVAHSHSHSDHYAGDGQFRALAKSHVIKPNLQSVVEFFNFKDWPNSNSNFDLGDRMLTVIPIPGHQQESIAIYDSESQFVLSGDTFYPGRLYIRDWNQFSNSIEQLTNLSLSKEIIGFLGAHIEMGEEGSDFPVGATYQPNEVDLLLSTHELMELHSIIKQLGDSPSIMQVGDVILYPVE